MNSWIYTGQCFLQSGKRCKIPTLVIPVRMAITTPAVSLVKDGACSARFGSSAAVSPCYAGSCWLHHQDATGRLQAYKQH